MLILSRADVQAALSMLETIEAMKSAFAALSDGRADVPLRINIPISELQASNLFMPSSYADDQGQALAIKFVSVYPQNNAQNLPLIHAAVLLIDSENGVPLALLEGSSLTAIRTGAGCGAATDILARQDSQVVAIFGAGVQGRTQLAAICAVRSVETVWVFDPDHKQVHNFIKEMTGIGDVPNDLRHAESPDQATVQADIICTATTSHTPVFLDEYRKPGRENSAQITFFKSVGNAVQDAAAAR